MITYITHYINNDTRVTKETAFSCVDEIVALKIITALDYLQVYKWKDSQWQLIGEQQGLLQSSKDEQ